MRYPILPFNLGNYPCVYEASGNRPKKSTVIYLALCLALIALTLLSSRSPQNVWVVAFLALILLALLIYWPVISHKTLTLNQDSIEYSTFFSKKSMNRTNIKGVQCNFGSRKLLSSFDGMIFVTGIAGSKNLRVPYCFKVDHLYDAWINSLPYLDGKYMGVSLNKDEAEYDTDFHIWKPNVISIPPKKLKKVRIRTALKILPRALLGLAIPFGMIGLMANGGISDLEAKGLRATGEIIDYTQECHLKWDGRNIIPYKSCDDFAIIKTEPEEGRLIPTQFKTRINDDPVVSHIGDRVTVLYDADRPEGYSKIDRGKLLNHLSLNHLCEFTIAMILLASLIWLVYGSDRPSPELPNKPSQP